MRAWEKSKQSPSTTNKLFSNYNLRILNLSAKFAIQNSRLPREKICVLVARFRHSLNFKSFLMYIKTCKAFQSLACRLYFP